MDGACVAKEGRTFITLTLLDTPQGVMIRADGDMTAPTGSASVARTLCTFADGLIEGGQLVRLGAEIQAAV